MNRKLETFLMKTFLLSVIFFVSSTYSFAQDKAAKIDELMSLYHEYNQFSGSVLVAEKGEVIYKNGFGFANIEWDIPNEADTKFRLSSITKQFTSMLIMMLVEKGKIKLDAKISDYLTDYRKDPGEKITIYNLLTHTSGIPDMSNRTEELRKHYAVEEYIDLFCSGDLEFEPGTNVKYCNSAYYLLGIIIEKVSGKKYEEVLQEYILDPLGMKNTGIDQFEKIIKRRATSYQRNVNIYKKDPYFYMPNFFSAGFMYSTVEDLYLWDQALYSEKLLSKKYKDIMFKPYFGKYACGWGCYKVQIGTTQDSTLLIVHTGGISGSNSRIARLVDDKHLIVLLGNVYVGAEKILEISQQITNILYNVPYNFPKKSITETIIKTFEEKGASFAIKQYNDLKSNNPDSYDYNIVNVLNVYGYFLISENRIEEAIEIFKLNVALYPKSWNTYDSLGEAYLINGNKDLAIKNYKISVELNPSRTKTVNLIKQLQEKE